VIKIPELPKVNQDFTADVSDYVAKMQAMVAAAGEFVKANEASIASVKALQAAIASLEDKTVTVTYRIVTIGDAPSGMGGTVTQVVNQVRGTTASAAEAAATQVVNQVSGTQAGSAAAAASQMVNPLPPGLDADLKAAASDMSALNEAVRQANASMSGYDASLERSMEAAATLDARQSELNTLFGEGSVAANNMTDAQRALYDTVVEENRVMGDYGGLLDSLSLRMGTAGDAQKAFAADLKDVETSMAAPEQSSTVFLSAINNMNDGMNKARATSDLLNEAMMEVSKGTIYASAAEAAGSGDTDRLAAVMASASAAGNLLSASTRDTGTAATAAAVPVGMLAAFWTRWGTVIHWVIAAGSEFLATFIPAMVAFGAAAAVMIQGAQNIEIRMLAVYTVAEALGPAIGQTAGQMVGLGDSLQKAQDAMQPQIYELFGAVLNGLKVHFGNLWQMGEQVITMLDEFAAKVDIELNGALGSELNGLVSKGVTDLMEFGQVLGNLGHALLNFASAMPGLAEVLLKLLDAFSHLILIISEIPAPIITAAMAFEEFLRWGSLVVGMFGGLLRGAALIMGAAGFDGASAAITDLVRALKGLPPAAAAAAMSEDELAAATTGDMTTFSGLFTRIIGFVAENPFGALAVLAIAALTAFGIWIDKAKSGTDQWIASVDNAVKSAPDFQQINTTVSALGANTEKAAAAQADLSSKTSAWSALASGAQENVSALATQHKQLMGDLNTESGDVVFLANKYGVNVPDAIALAQAAGVKLTTNLQGQSQEAQVARQMITNLITGYQAMGQQGNQLYNDINAVTIANSTQIESVQKLNTAWQSVTANMTGVQTTFITVQQGINTVSNDFKTAGATIDGLNAQSLTLRSDFETNITNSANTVNSLNTAMSLGGISFTNYRKAIAGIVAEQLPFAQGSQQALSQLSELSQMAGGPATTNYNTLQQWTNKYGTTQQGVNGIMAQTTIQMSNIGQMAGKLQGTLQTDVIDTTASAALAQGGFQKELSATFDAYKAGGPASAGFKSDLTQLDATLKAAGFSTQQVTQYNQFLEKQLGQTGDSMTGTANKSAALGTAFDQQKIKSDGLRDEIKNVFIAIGHYVEQYTDDAVNALINGWKGAVSTAINIWNGLVSGVETAWRNIESFAKTIWQDIYNDIYDPIKRAIDDVKSAFTTGFDGWWKTHGTEVEQVWQAVWTNVTDIAKQSWGLIEPVIKTMWDFISSDFKIGGALIEGIWTLLWDGIALTAKVAWDAISATAKTAWDLLAAIFKVGEALLTAAWQLFWGAVKATFVVAWDLLAAIAKIAWDTFVAVFSVFLDLVTGHWSEAWDDIKNYGEQVWNAVKVFFEQAWNALSAYWENILTIMEHLFESIWNAIKDFGEQEWNAIKAFFEQVWNAMKDYITQVLNDIHDTFTNIWHAIYDETTSIWNNCMSFLRNIWSELKSGFEGAVNGIKSTWDTLENIFRTPVSFLVNTVYDNGIARLWNDVAAKIPGIPSLPHVSFERGGMVPGGFGGGDIVPVLAEPGEAFVNKHTAAKYSNVLGEMGVPGFATGGVVPASGGSKFGPTSPGAANPTGPALGPLQGAANAIIGGYKDAADVVKILTALATGNTGALSNAFDSLIKDAGAMGAAGDLATMMEKIPETIVGDILNDLKTLWAGAVNAALNPSSGIGTGSDILSYAESFVGKVPYVWGGDTPAGWDCSGFTKYVYDHFGYSSIPRTSEAQATWVTRGSPTPGGLAFFAGSDGTAAAPGHVGIVVNPGMMVDAYGTGYGTRYNSLAGMLWAGTPPGGFHAGPAVGAGSPGVGSLIANASAIGHYLEAAGANKIATAGIMGNMLQESGGNWNIGGGGLIQILGASPTSLGQSLQQTISYINANGGMGPINAAYNVAQATEIFMNQYERPAPATENLARRLAGANAAYAAGYSRGGIVGYDSGGLLMPGLTLAMNGTGQPERVVSPSGAGGGQDYMIHNVVNLDGQKIWDCMQQRTFQYNIRNGGGGNITGAMRPYSGGGQG